MPDALPSPDALAEQAYLVARGVRRMSLAGHLHLPEEAAEVALLTVATEVERHAEPNAVPFVVDHGDGVASFGYAESRWALDLYEWAMKDPAVPQEQRHRIVGLLLGYGTPAISRHEEQGSGRRFAQAVRWPGQDASSPRDGSASKGERSPLC
ncbi:MAG TPA: hypothetical protein VGN13_08155 [Solirubrobacteraceae bacterium]|jgi:hypothetical protein